MNQCVRCGSLAINDNEPVVCEPDEALECVLGGVDLLFKGDRMVIRKEH
jgi:hypothetical protein